MKRIALMLSVVALLVGSVVYAPAATAKKAPGQVNILHAKKLLDKIASPLAVIGVIECTEGDSYLVSLSVSQDKSIGYGTSLVSCPTSGREHFGVDVKPVSFLDPFKRGELAQVKWSSTNGSTGEVREGEEWVYVD